VSAPLPAVEAVRTWGRMVKFSHSVFALPFALLSLWLAHGGTPPLSLLGWVLLAMVAARSAAMGTNRIADRAFDAENPRTAERHLVTGALSVRFALVFSVVAAAAFVSVFAILLMMFTHSATLAIIAVVLNYAKRAEATGSFLESHFRWQIRTFWFAVPWALLGAILWLTLLLIPLAVVGPRLVALLHERGAITAAFTDKGDDFAVTFVHTGTYGFIPGQPSAYTQPLYGFFLIPMYWILGRHWLWIGLAQIAVALGVASAAVLAQIAIMLSGAPIIWVSLVSAVALTVVALTIWRRRVHAANDLAVVDALSFGDVLRARNATEAL